MSKGVVIIALKRAAYSLGAFNLAVSIKHHSPSIQITLLSDGEHLRHYGVGHFSVFDTIKEMNPDDYLTDGKFEPGKAKLSFYSYSPYDSTFYVDADSLCLKDISPLLDELESQPGYIYSNVLGSGKKEDDIQYSVWATNKQVWDFFKLKPDATLNNVNSSWIFVKKGKKAEKFFASLKKNYDKGFGHENLLHGWGGTYPDELFYNGTMAQLDIDPKFPDKVMFFGNRMDNRTKEQLTNDYYFFTLYGKGKGVTTVRLEYIEWYDKLLFKICTNRGHEHHFKANALMSGKHINK